MIVEYQQTIVTLIDVPIVLHYSFLRGEEWFRDVSSGTTTASSFCVVSHTLLAINERTTNIILGAFCHHTFGHPDAGHFLLCLSLASSGVPICFG